MDLPLVSPNQSQINIQTVVSDEEPTAASTRIAAGDQLYLTSVPLLQESYLFGIADWYSLVTTLLSSHWGTISAAYSTADSRPDPQHELGTNNQQDVSTWTSWTWLQSFFQGLSAHHRQVDVTNQLLLLLLMCSL